MKKLLFNISCICLLVVYCTSCGNQSEEWIGGDTPILLSAQAIDGIGTRSIIAGGQALPTDLKVGVYIAENGGTNPAIASNQEYTVNTVGGLNVAGGSQPYYPSSGNGVKMSAYHPYNAGAPDTYDFSVADNQSSDDAYNGSDLLYSDTRSYARKSAAHSLAFEHKLVRITYSLEPKEGAPSLVGATVKILNILPTAEFDRINGTVGTAKGTATTITPNAGGAIVVPQTIAGNTRLIEVAAGGNKYYYKPTGDLSMWSDKSYDFKIGVTGTRLQVTYTVSDWTTGTINDNGGAVSARSYRVGDYYPDPNVDLTIQAEKDKIQGIVFWIDPAGGGKHGKIVSLDEETGRWGDFGTNEKGAGVTGIQDWDDGKTATKNLIAARKNENVFSTNYYAFNWIYQTKNNGNIDGIWYLPAKNELQHLYCAYNGAAPVIWTTGAPAPNQDARTAFDAKLIAAGGTELTPREHWSSSEKEFTYGYAWIVNLDNGNTDDGDKYASRRVRAVSAF